MNNDTLKGTAKKFGGAIESSYGEATGNTSAQIKGEGKKAEGKILSVFGNIEDRVSDIVHSAEEHTETLKNQIKEKPVQSSLIALAVGFIIGRLFV